MKALHFASRKGTPVNLVVTNFGFSLSEWKNNANWTFDTKAQSTRSSVLFGGEWKE